jgi:hypothetical protein
MIQCERLSSFVSVQVIRFRDYVYVKFSTQFYLNMLTNAVESSSKDNSFNDKEDILFPFTKIENHDSVLS